MNQDLVELTLDSVRIMTISSLVQGSKSLIQPSGESFTTTVPVPPGAPVRSKHRDLLVFGGYHILFFGDEQKAAHTILERQVDD